MDYFINVIIYSAGCRHTCQRTSVVALCCPGYWGPDCNGHFQLLSLFILCYSITASCFCISFTHRLSGKFRSITLHWDSLCLVADCPGGAEAPCSGHGQCFDGLYGNGSCTCAVGYIIRLSFSPRRWISEFATVESAVGKEAKLFSPGCRIFQSSLGF